jgi:uncharacterized protein (TIGR00251 family)
VALPAWIGPAGDAVQLSIRLTPRAARDEVGGGRAETLRVRVSASATEGRANEALCRLLAKRLGVARSQVELVGGRRSRQKLVRVTGISAPEAAVRLAPRGRRQQGSLQGVAW